MKERFLLAVLALAVGGVFARPPNYDESKVAPYTLEDPLTFADGRKLKDAAEWPARRKEILEIFAREMYGQPPPPPETVVTELVEEGPTLGGLGIRRQYKMWFKADKSGPMIDWIVFLPNQIQGLSPKKGKVPACENARKVPVILFLNYRGNQELVTDPEVIFPANIWVRNNKSLDCKDHKPEFEKTRGRQRRTAETSVFPLETILARGYAVMSACYGQVSPDVEERDVKNGTPRETAYTGVFTLWPKRDESRDDNTTALGAWAWALSRGLDLAERIPEIDATKSVATGCSRLAKTALLAAARRGRRAARQARLRRKRLDRDEHVPPLVLQGVQQVRGQRAGDEVRPAPDRRGDRAAPHPRAGLQLGVVRHEGRVPLLPRRVAGLGVPRQARPAGGRIPRELRHRPHRPLSRLCAARRTARHHRLRLDVDA